VEAKPRYLIYILVIIIITPANIPIAPFHLGTRLPLSEAEVIVASNIFVTIYEIFKRSCL
jgi:hypothetical protein